MQDIPWALIIPLAVIQLVLMVIALVDLVGRRETNGLPKLGWLLVIIFVNLIGPVLYLTIGRKES